MLLRRPLGLALLALSVLSLMATADFIRFIRAGGLTVLSALAESDVAIEGARFHTVGWTAWVNRGGEDSARISLYWGDAASHNLPQHGLQDQRLLVKTGDTPPIYVLKGEGISLEWICGPQPLEPFEVIGVLADPDAPDPLMTRPCQRLRYFRDATTFVDERYWNNLPRLWEEGQTLPLLFTPFELAHQALLLLWTPVWALLPPGAFIVTFWLMLGGTAVAGAILWLLPAKSKERTMV